VVDDALSRPDDALLLVEVFLGEVEGVEIEVGPADQIVRAIPAKIDRGRLVGDDEAAVDILDEQQVRDLVDQRAQQDAFVLAVGPANSAPRRCGREAVATPGHLPAIPARGIGAPGQDAARDAVRSY
jgi:hypothetical protein